MANLQELIAQTEALDQQLQALQRSQRADAIAQVRALMNQFGLTAADLRGAPAKAAGRPAAAGGKVPTKYRDPASGQTWSGRGLKPKWLAAALAQGKTLEEFAVAQA